MSEPSDKIKRAEELISKWETATRRLPVDNKECQDLFDLLKQTLRDQGTLKDRAWREVPDMQNKAGKLGFNLFDDKYEEVFFRGLELALAVRVAKNAIAAGPSQEGIVALTLVKILEDALNDQLHKLGVER